MTTVRLDRADSPTIFISGQAWANRDDEARYRDYGTHAELVAGGATTRADALDVSDRDLPTLPLPTDIGALPAKMSLDECQALINSFPPVAIYWNPGPWPVCHGRPMRLLLVNPTKSEWAWLAAVLNVPTARIYIDDVDGLGLSAELVTASQEPIEPLDEELANELGHNVFQCLETGRVAAVMTHT